MPDHRPGPDHRPELAVSRRRVIDALNVNRDWTAAAHELGIGAGLAFMIATGIPADGSGVPELPEPAAGVAPPNSPQSLVNDRPHNPVRNETVDAWMRARAGKELQR